MTGFVKICAAAAASLLAAAPQALATPVLAADISISDIMITPASDSVTFAGPWQAQVFAIASNSLGQVAAAIDQGTGDLNVAPGVSLVSAQADVSPAALGLHVSSAVGQMGPAVDRGDAFAQSGLFNSFHIAGGAGAVDVTFSMRLTGSIQRPSEGDNHYLTETTAILQLDGQPILFNFEQVFGPAFLPDVLFDEVLSQTVTLTYGVDHLAFYGVTDNIHRTTPEPGTVALLLPILLLLGIGRTSANMT